MLPDPEVRSRFCAECPPLPEALFEEVRPPARSRPDGPCGYVRCSDAYREQADAARERGWPTVEPDGRHLSVVSEPERVVDPLLDLVARLRA